MPAVLTRREASSLRPMSVRARTTSRRRHVRGARRVKIQGLGQINQRTPATRPSLASSLLASIPQSILPSPLSHPLMSYKAIILVGGPSRGTRFRPLSLDVPKPLFPVAGQAIIWHHLAALAKVEGLKEVLLIGFFEDSVFSRFIDDSSTQFPHIHIR